MELQAIAYRNENQDSAQWERASSSPIPPAKEEARIPLAKDGEPSKSIEVRFPGERFGELTLSFKAPLREILVASANRLLRFEFPVLRNIKVCERLIKTNIISTGLSKKMLESLPAPFLEIIYRRLWERCLNSEGASADVLLSLFLLVEELSEFRAEQMVLEDIRLLGLQEFGTLHSYYYSGDLSREQMITVLSGQQYRTDFLEKIPEHSKQELHLAYLTCRRLSAPLPWNTLLDSLDTAELERFPALRRLKTVAELLRKQAWATRPIQPATLSKMVAHLQDFLERPELAAIASDTGLAVPVKALVLVEGETEKMLLPLFAKSMGLDFSALGLQVWPAGGKNHVPAIYKDSAPNLSIPLCIVLDSDAIETADELREILRPQDVVFQITEGEFEDTYEMKLILSAINHHYQPYPEITASAFKEIADEAKARNRVQSLKAVWHAYGWGSFDKIEFARQYAEAFQAAYPRNGKPLPATISQLLEIILAVRANGQATNTQVSLEA